MMRCAVSGLYHASIGVTNISVADGFIDEEAVIRPPQVTDGNAVTENGLKSKHRHFPVDRERKEAGFNHM